METINNHKIKLLIVVTTCTWKDHTRRYSNLNRKSLIKTLWNCGNKYLKELMNTWNHQQYLYQKQQLKQITCLILTTTLYNG